MNPIYIGDTHIEEVPGAKLKIKRGQAATLSRPFEGNPSGVAAFLAANPIWVATDYEYPSMVLDEITVDYEGPVAKITLIYYGLPTGHGISSNLQRDFKYEARNAQLDTTVAADGEYSVNYYSPVITYRYTTDSLISDPLYKGDTLNPSSVTLLDYKSAPPFNSPPYASAATGYVLLGVLRFKPYSFCSNFESHQKGNIFNNQETWAVCISNFTKPATAIGIGSISDPVS